MKKTILFFIAGMVPTAAERAFIARIRESKTIRLSVRNASQFNEKESLEKADFVCGLVPSVYKDFARFESEPEPEAVVVPIESSSLASLQAAEISVPETQVELVLSNQPAEPAPIVANEPVQPVATPAEVPAAPVASVAVSKTKPAKEAKSGKKRR